MLIKKEDLISELEKFCGNQRYLISEEIWDIIINFPECNERQNSDDTSR